MIILILYTTPNFEKTFNVMSLCVEEQRNKKLIQVLTQHVYKDAEWHEDCACVKYACMHICMCLRFYVSTSRGLRSGGRTARVVKNRALERKVHIHCSSGSKLLRFEIISVTHFQLYHRAERGQQKTDVRRRPYSQSPLLSVLSLVLSATSSTTQLSAATELNPIGNSVEIARHNHSRHASHKQYHKPENCRLVIVQLAPLLLCKET